MNILCCFKISPDYDKVVSADWCAAKPPAPDTSYVPKELGCYDEAALEMALRLKDEAERAGVSVTVTAVTVGEGQCDHFARGLFALGVGRVVQLRLPQALDFQPGTVSEAIAEAFSDLRFDAVFCGAQSSEGGGMTPYLLAKKFEMPCLPNVTELHYHQNGLRVTRETFNGESEVTVTAPAVYAVFNSRHPFLRMATVKKRLAVADMGAEIMEFSASVPERFALLRFSYDAGGRPCVFVEGESCMEKAEKLLQLCPEVRA